MRNEINRSLLNNKMCFYSFIGKFTSSFREKLNEILENNEINNPNSIADDNTNKMYQKIYLLSIRTLIYELYVWKEETLEETLHMTSNERYLAFCRNFEKRDYYEKFCKKYDVLISKINILHENTLSFLDEVIKNLKEDSSKLSNSFNFKVQNIKSLETIGDGDCHNQGKQAMILSDGYIKLIYKPHTLMTDVFLAELFEELNKKLSLDLKVPKTISKEKYGWQEFVEKKECNTKNKYHNYFYRYGELLCVAYCLNMTDIHKENLIECGEYPIIIDTETIILNNSYNLNVTKEDSLTINSPQKILNNSISKSVINTFLLPNNVLGGFYDVDLSPLGASEKQSSENLAGYTIKNEFTDEICFDKEYYKQESCYGVNACDYLMEILDGFSECYQLILENKKSFKSNIIYKMKKYQLAVRQVLRPTYIYYKFYDASNHPDYLKNGQVQAELVGKLKSKRYMKDIKLVQQANIEIESLLQGDIPYFYEYASSKNLYSEYGTIIDFYCKNIIELVDERIDSICFEDLITQQRMIRLSMSTLLESNWNHENRGYERKIKDYLNYIIGDEKAIPKMIADYVCHEAVWSNDKKICIWPSHALISQKLKIHSLNYFLYDGGGVILFLNHLAKKTKNDKYRQIADCGLEGFLQSQLSNSLSAFNGVGSLLYIYYSLYKIWGESKYYKNYKETLNKILLLEISENDPIDYCNGIAGMAVLVQNLYLEEKDPVLLMLAKRYTDYCIKNIHKVNLAGLAHGYAGVSLAVSGYYNICKESKYYTEAERIVKMENIYYDNIKCNWKDLRDEDNGGDPVYWCYGATGVCLSRMKAYQYTKSEICKTDMKKCIKKIESSMLYLKDHSLCHGMFGNIDCLISVRDEFEEYSIELSRLIEQKYFLVMKDIKENGVVCGISNAYDMFSFMLGITGIAYSIMRKQNVGYPSVLLLEV